MVTDVIALMVNNTTLANLVGENSTGDKPKIYPVMVPQKEKHPYITVRQSSKVRAGKGCGFINGIEVSSYAKSYDDVVALDDAVLNAIENNGTFLSLTGTSDGFVHQADGNGLYVRTSSFEGANT